MNKGISSDSNWLNCLFKEQATSKHDPDKCCYNDLQNYGIWKQRHEIFRLV